MKNSFLVQNAKWLFAPMLMMLASGFGQTFFIAIFGDAIRAEFGLSYGDWGGIYMLGTLVSAAALITFGSVADRMPARRLVTTVVLCMMGSSLAMAANPFVWALPLIIFGLRFFGQGMMTHIAQVIGARWFRANRGKAMAYAAFGIALAEATFPMIGVRVVQLVGWRWTWVLAALTLGLIGLILFQRLGEARTPQGQTATERSAGLDGRDWTRREMLHNWVFWVAFPATLTMPFLSTIFFFQIPVLASSKGWDLVDTAARLPIFSLIAFLTMLVTGALLDRFGTRKIMGYIYLPMVLGYATLSQVTTLNGFFAALMVMGFAQGAAAGLASVFWADFYGTKNLGAIRSVATGVMVFATSIGPFISGSLLDRGIKYDTQLMMMSGYAALAVLLMMIVSLGTRDRFAQS